MFVGFVLLLFCFVLLLLLLLLFLFLLLCLFVVFVCCGFGASFCCYPVFLCGCCMFCFLFVCLFWPLFLLPSVCLWLLYVAVVSWPLFAFTQCLFVVVVCFLVCFFGLFLFLPSVCLWLLYVFWCVFWPLFVLTQCLFVVVGCCGGFWPLFAVTQCLWLLYVFLLFCFGLFLLLPSVCGCCMLLFFWPLSALTQHRGDCETVFPEWGPVARSMCSETPLTLSLPAFHLYRLCCFSPLITLKRGSDNQKVLCSRCILAEEVDWADMCNKLKITEIRIDPGGIVHWLGGFV